MTYSNTSLASSHSLQKSNASNNNTGKPKQSFSSTNLVNLSKSSRKYSNIAMGHLRFLVMDCPDEANLPEYIQELLLRGVTDVVRLCDPIYSTSELLKSGIKVHELPFADGGLPPTDVIQTFLSLVEERFGVLTLSSRIIDERSVTILEGSPVIAVHCVGTHIF